MDSFATSYWYVPTAIEWLVVGGILAFGGLLLAAMVLLTIVVLTTPALNDLMDLIWLKLKIILGIQ